MYGLNHSLTLDRKTDDDAIFKRAAAGADVSLDKMSWFMPHVIPADAEKHSIYKTIESKVKLPEAYRTRYCDMLSVPDSTNFTWRLGVETAPEKLRVIIVGFQTVKDDNQTKNSSTFDHANLKNAYVTLNTCRYPAVDYNLSFSNQKFSRVYGDAALFRVKIFSIDELITPCDYKTLYPLFTFDVSKLKQKLKSPVMISGKFH